jgi:serine protease inhibitor
LKEDIRNQNFSSDEEGEAAVCQWFQEKAKDRIQKLIEVGGDNVEN